VKTTIVGLVKVENAIKVGNANTTSVIPKHIDVAQSYFVGIVVRSSIKLSLYLFEF
jgi:hypothetical protein